MMLQIKALLAEEDKMNKMFSFVCWKSKQNETLSIALVRLLLNYRWTDLSYSYIGWIYIVGTRLTWILLIFLQNDW